MTAPGGFELTPREGPGHAGVGATFCGRPLVHEPSGLEGVDIADGPFAPTVGAVGVRT